MRTLWIILLLLFSLDVQPAVSSDGDLTLGVPFPENTREHTLLFEEIQRINQDSEEGLTISLRFVKDQNDSLADMAVSGELAGLLAVEHDFRTLGLDPDGLLYGLPFTFISENQVASVRSALDPFVLQRLSDGSFTALKIVGFGFMHLVSAKPLTTISDWQSQTIWVPPVDSVSTSGISGIGMTVSMNDPKEVLMGLKSKEIDGLISPLPLLVLKRWHTRMKHIFPYPIAYSYGIWLIEDGRFNELSYGQRRELTESIKKLSLLMSNALSDRSTGAVKVLQRYRIVFAEPENSFAEQWPSFFQQSLENLDVGVRPSAKALEKLRAQLLQRAE
ncbi:MAG: hypothetical protein D6B25_05860 [Desulfobulbaceae bacterium]|nr:MAG: hypothetical protein D6B25_05860 [Desulfobulbaceae bacterium]